MVHLTPFSAVTFAVETQFVEEVKLIAEVRRMVGTGNLVETLFVEVVWPAVVAPETRLAGLE